MAIIRWRRETDPYFSQMNQMREAMDQLFDSYLAPVATTRREFPFVPAVDVTENKENVTVKAEVPGLKPEDIEINLTGNLLTLKGEKKQETESKDQNWHRVERTWGSFTRSLELPDGIDPEKVAANYDKGVLSIEIAKSDKVKPRSIKVNVK